MTAPIKVKSNLDSSILRIELFLSNLCNYKCWYCFPGSHEGTHPWPKYKTFIDNFDYLINYYKTNKNKKTIYIHIIGGEPTLWKELGEFVKYLKEEHGCIVSMSSNGSRTLRWWDEYGHYFDHVMLSCHHERIDVDQIINVGDLLYSKNVTVNALVLMDPNVWDTCISIVDKLKTSKKRWFISAVEINHATVSYNTEQRKYLAKPCKRISNLWHFFRNKKTPHASPTITFENGTSKTVNQNWLSLEKLNYFTGWECNLGVDTFYIDKEGLLQGACGNTLYDLDFKYNIFDEDFREQFNPEIKPTICKQLACTCQPEQNCNKKVISLVKL